MIAKKKFEANVYNSVHNINQRDPNKNIKKVHRSNFVDTV